MRIDQDHFRSLLQETIDENPLASRAVLSLCGVEFTKQVDSLSVSLGRRSLLRVNLDFLSRHCHTEKHVKAVLIHEFLHILLGHTLKFDKMTPALNVALDAVINAIIHRRLGGEYSSMMELYYSDARGLLRLLRPPTDTEEANGDHARWNKLPGDPLFELHEKIYSGEALAEDVLSTAKGFADESLAAALAGGLILLGDHEHRPAQIEDLDEGTQRRLVQALAALDATGILRDHDKLKPQLLSSTPIQRQVPSEWCRQTLPVLRRLLVPYAKSPLRVMQPRTHLAPVLNSSDRRGALRALWNPLVPDIIWHTEHPRAAGSVQIYLDVSGSMNAFLNAIVSLLANFSMHIRHPLWAFSTEVHPARIIRGELKTKTTGGTHLGCVFEHIRKTQPAKALVITDGYVEGANGNPRPRDLCQIEALIPHDGHARVLVEEHRIPTTTLAKLPACNMEQVALGLRMFGLRNRSMEGAEFLPTAHWPL